MCRFCIFMNTAEHRGWSQNDKGRPREGFIMIIIKKSKHRDELYSLAETRLSYLLQLVSGGGDRYTEPYGQLSMWDWGLRKYSWRLTVLADSMHQLQRILPAREDIIKSSAGSLMNEPWTHHRGLMFVSTLASSLHMLLITNTPTEHHYLTWINYRLMS